MKTIHNTEEFLALIGPDGRVTESVQLADGCELDDLNALTSLDGVTLAEGCALYDLTGLRSLEGVTLAEGCVLFGLTGLTSLAGVALAEGCWLDNLTGLTSLNGVTLVEGCWMSGYIPWGIRFRHNRLDIGCETFLPGVTDEYIRDVIARHGAKGHTDRIFEVVNLWRGWLA